MLWLLRVRRMSFEKIAANEEKRSEGDHAMIQEALAIIAMRPVRAEGSWRDVALCSAGNISPDIFEPGTTKGSKEDIDRAKRICNACSVQENCLAYALDPNVDTDDLIWGGTTSTERRALARRRLNRSRRQL